MKSLLINIARLNLLRTAWHKLRSTVADEDCYKAFVAAMNKQSEEWKLENTKWINPSGLGENNQYSESTARDLAIMALHVFTKENKFHGRDVYLLKVIKPYFIPRYRVKQKIVYSTTTLETIGNNYPIFGAKTGSGDGYQTLVMVCKIGDSIVSGAVMNADNEQGRFEAMDDLMNFAHDILSKSKETNNYVCTKARNACLYRLDNNGQQVCLFAQNADEKSPPMSTTKVMTLALVKKYKIDMNQLVFITPYDTQNAGNDILYDWDKLSIQDLVNIMMRCSSNVAANALARIIGEKISKFDK